VFFKNKINFIHQFKSFVPQGATALIIGTFPLLAQYWNFKFFYSNNRGNRFLIIMKYVFNHKFQYCKDEAAAKERKSFFEREHIVITDMIEKFTKTSDDSSDKNLSETEFRNVHKLSKDRTAMQKIMLTSITDGDSRQIHKNI
jgi:G:T/U-mismatch repair DNA glycosylase